jgi:hypothetical protein
MAITDSKSARIPEVRVPIHLMIKKLTNVILKDTVYSSIKRLHHACTPFWDEGCGGFGCAKCVQYGQYFLTCKDVEGNKSWFI